MFLADEVFVSNVYAIVVLISILYSPQKKYTFIISIKVFVRFITASATTATSATTSIATAAATATPASAATATPASTTTATSATTAASTSARTRRSHHSRTWFHTHLSLIPNKSQTFICHILFHNHLIFNLLINTGPPGIPFHFLTISLSHPLTFPPSPPLTLSPSHSLLFPLLLFYLFTFLPFPPRHSSLHHQPLHRISHASVHIRRVHLQPVRHARHDALAQLAP